MTALVFVLFMTTTSASAAVIPKSDYNAAVEYKTAHPNWDICVYGYADDFSEDTLIFNFYKDPSNSDTMIMRDPITKECKQYSCDDLLTGGYMHVWTNIPSYKEVRKTHTDNSIILFE